jgi:recombinational DNA repair protein (RecF pathway)
MDIESLELTAKAAALIEKHTETGTPLPGFFTLFRDYIASMKDTPHYLAGASAFKLKFLVEEGLTPDLNAAALSPAVKLMLSHIIEFDWDIIARIKPTAHQLHEMTAFLDRFINENL